MNGRFSCATALCVLLNVALVTADEPAAGSADDGFVPLFNGHDLSGWELVNTPPQTWQYEDGRLVCSGRPIGEIRTAKMYQNFILELEWRHMVPRGNAGVFVWADDITALGQPFHRGIEVQVLENSYGNTRSYSTHGDIFPIHGARMTPVNGRGGSRAFPTEERSRPSPQWNHYRIECRDGNISLAVNGRVVTRGQDCSPRKGYICLESEGGIVHYRNVRIRELPSSDVPQEHVAVADRGFRSLYTGLDLSGWHTSAAGQTAWRVKDWVLSFDDTAAGDKATDTSLTTTEAIDCGGLICDFKPGRNARFVLELRDATEAVVQTVDLGDAEFAALRKSGRWNRLEIVRDGARAQVRLNGTPTAVADADLRRQSVATDTAQATDQATANAAPRAINPVFVTLRPAGQIDFANLYVRPARH